MYIYTFFLLCLFWNKLFFSIKGHLVILSFVFFPNWLSSVFIQKDIKTSHQTHCTALPFGDTLRDFLLSEGHSLLLLGEKLFLLPRRSSVNTQKGIKGSQMKETTKTRAWYCHAILYVATCLADVVELEGREGDREEVKQAMSSWRCACSVSSKERGCSTEGGRCAQLIHMCLRQRKGLSLYASSTCLHPTGCTQLFISHPLIPNVWHKTAWFLQTYMMYSLSFQKLSVRWHYCYIVSFC